jgi:hypothetical protein
MHEGIVNDIGTDGQSGKRRSRFRRAGTFAISLVGIALLTAACSAAVSGPGVAQVGSTTSTTANASSSGGSATPSLLAFSTCMRSHGEPNFPDPNSQGQLSIASGAGIDPQSSRYRSAQAACQKLAPGGANQSPAQQVKSRSAALKFAACMRSHGISDFPDPNSEGEIVVSGGKGGGSDLNRNSPQLQTAQKACQALGGGGNS